MSHHAVTVTCITACVASCRECVCRLRTIRFACRYEAPTTASVKQLEKFCTRNTRDLRERSAVELRTLFRCRLVMDRDPLWRDEHPAGHHWLLPFRSGYGGDRMLWA
jgi:hypothetical protein